MKSEHEIAKESIEKLKSDLPEMTQANMSGIIIGHLTSCQRFLEFLESSDMYDAKYSGNYNSL